MKQYAVLLACGVSAFAAMFAFQNWRQTDAPLAAARSEIAAVASAPLAERAPPGTGGPVEAASGQAMASVPPGPAPEGMVWIPGGRFVMGSDHRLSRPDERPRHQVQVDGFWMDQTEVTNAAFARFVEATGYVTTAERPVDWEEMKRQLPPGTPKPADEQLQPGALVFVPPTRPVPLDNVGAWWRWTTGANWRHPEGPESNISGREQHPVVHVSWDDAVAYCRWAQRRLPTEAEWEFAARGGLREQPFVWGDAPLSETRPQANIWQGRFPHENSAADGYLRTAPVRSFAANGYGLFDMAGNVWEWCSDWYRPDAYQLQAAEQPAINPAGPAQPFDPRRPLMPQRVQRGGSFLCNDVYCASYRPAARMPCSPDTGMSHVGFRCVKNR